MAGKVSVDGRIADKPGRLVSEEARLCIAEDDNPFVSRGGLKLARALDHFQIDVRGAVCMDVGASTGGFTHCLLEKGAAKIYAIDVGYGQLDWRLRNDPRVAVMERTNIRHLAPGALPERPDLAVIDVSFISLKIVVPSVLPHLSYDGRVVALIKPQFEAGRKDVGKGGVVKDPDVQARVVEELTGFFTSIGLDVFGTIPSPIKGAKGNQEFLIYMSLKQAQQEE